MPLTIDGLSVPTGGDDLRLHNVAVVAPQSVASEPATDTLLPTGVVTVLCRAVDISAADARTRTQGSVPQEQSS